MANTVMNANVAVAVHAPRYPRRKHPVHPPPVERPNAPVVLFVTLTIQQRVPVCNTIAFQNAFQTARSVAGAWRVASYLLMPDHIHLFCVPHRIPCIPIAAWCEFLKRQTTLALGPHPDWKWQAGCWDTQMRDIAHYDEKRVYVAMNPVRKGLVATPDEWPWRGEFEPVAW